MKYYLLVEGHTEEKVVAPFVKRWLDAQLPHPVSISPIKYHGYGALLKDVVTRSRMILNNPLADPAGIAVFSLLDYYGPSFPYPQECDTVTERCQWAKEYIESQVGEARFRHHFAVHELEAWLLSEHAIFPAEIRRHLPQRAPETVNTTEPPKALLRRLYRQHTGKNYKETVNGPDLFRKLDPNDAYKKCPHLSALLDDMLSFTQ